MYDRFLSHRLCCCQRVCGLCSWMAISSTADLHGSAVLTVGLSQAASYFVSERNRLRKWSGFSIWTPWKGLSESRSLSPVTMHAARPSRANAKILLSLGSRQAVMVV